MGFVLRKKTPSNILFQSTTLLKTKQKEANTFTELKERSSQLYYGAHAKKTTPFFYTNKSIVTASTTVTLIITPHRIKFFCSSLQCFQVPLQLMSLSAELNNCRYKRL